MLESLKAPVLYLSLLALIGTLIFILWHREIFWLALRNLMKNRRRTSILLAVITSGLIGLMGFFGYAEQMIFGLREGTIRSGLGHIQLYKKGYNASGNVDKLQYNIPNYQEITNIIQRDPFLQDQIELIGAQLYFSGIIASGKTSAIFGGKGIEVDKDKLLSESDELREGKRLEKVDLVFKKKEEISRLQEFPEMFEEFEVEKPRQKPTRNIWKPKDVGQAKDEPGADDVLIGKGLATSIGARVGTVLTLMVCTKTNSLNALDVRVRGIITGMSKEYNDSIVKMSLPYTWLLMNREDVSQISILLKNTDMTEAAYDRISSIVADKNLDIELTKWYDIALYYRDVHMLFVSIFLTIGIVISTVVFFAIANVVTMSVTERTRDIGMLRALGETKFGIMQIFIMEGILIGMIGGLISVMSGIGIAEFINRVIGGIPHPPMPGTTEGYQVMFYIANRPIIWGIAFLLAFFTALFSSIVPAKKAAAMQIVDSLRYV